MSSSYVEPVGFLTGSIASRAVVAGQALFLSGSGIAFTHIALLHRHAPATLVPVDAADPELLSPLIAERPLYAGLDLGTPRIMGILNVTPDSFSDGGKSLAVDVAVATAHRLVEEGADIIDVGGESTRPGADPVDPEEEWRRVGPVVRQLAEDGLIVSIDTRHALVMENALAAGAAIVNDVSALSFDPRSLDVVASSTAPVMLMHMRGVPKTMQAAPSYDHVALEIFDELKARVDACIDAGIAPERICVDPGIGFAKTPAHNMEALAHVALFHGLGLPLLLGVSRKGGLKAEWRPDQVPERRLGSSLAAGLSGIGHGVQFLRVHDVADTKQAITVWQAIASA